MIATESIPTISLDEGVQLQYEAMRRDGQSHNMAEMLATRTLPGAKTDTAFMTKFGSNAGVPQAYLDKARKAGINTNSNYYCGDVAKFPGDPAAWVSSRGDIKRICEKNNWKAEGAVEHKCTPEAAKDDDDPYRVDDALVKEEVSRVAKLDPGLVDTPKARERTVEDVREKITPNL